MGHLLATIDSRIDHTTITVVGDSLLCRHSLRNNKQMAQKLFVLRGRSLDADNRFSWNHQHVSRCLRRDILQDDAVVVVKQNLPRDLALHDLCENTCVAHPLSPVGWLCESDDYHPCLQRGTQSREHDRFRASVLRRSIMDV